MSLKISVLGSSSSGNSTFISTNKTRILLDAGFSHAQTIKRLQTIGECLDNIDALIISHEHTDHTDGLGSLLRQHDIPVYIAGATYEALQPAISCNKVEWIKAGQSFWLDDLKVSPFSVPHDAADPLAFTFEADGMKIGHVTDLGYVTELVVQKLKGCDVIILESNHDLEMLKVGPYPWFVKQRIMSRQGHLSNEMTAKFITEAFDGQARYIVLAHLSDNNNHPGIARMIVTQALECKDFDLRNLLLASKTGPSPVIEI